MTQTPDVSTSSSKDHIIIARLAAILHIMECGFTWAELSDSSSTHKRRKTRTRQGASQTQENAKGPINIPAQIPESSLIAAELIVVNSRKQKLLFLEVCKMFIRTYIF